jgi:hypothetical protein
MPRLTRLLIVVLLSGAFVTLAPRRVFACSCPGHGNPLYESPNADAIFTGKIVSQGWIFAPQDVIFEVSTVWKGPEASQLVIRAESMCDYPFDAKYAYLVFAYKNQNGFYASRCSRTMEVNAALANGEFARLGPGKTIIAPPESTNWPVYVFGFLGLLVLVVSIVVWRHRSKYREMTS